MATSSVRTVSTNALDLNAMRKERSLWGDAWRRLSRNRAAVAGIIVIIFFALVAIFAPLIAKHNPVLQTSNNSLRLPAWVQDKNPGRAGNPDYLLGTDAVGRDIFSELIYGARVSMIVGFIPQVLILLIGVTIGLVAGFSGGRTDNLLMRFTDIIYAFPDTLFVITIATAFRETWIGQTFNGLLLIFVAFSVVAWTGMARLVRGQVLSLKEKEFVEAARTVGVSTPKILFRHILPNSLAPIIVAVTFGIPGAIIGEAVLTFIGVGMRPSLDPSNPFPTSWGSMLLEGYANINSTPYMLLFPVICVGLLTMAFTFLGDGLRDALDPRDQ
jgi:oligopeptide transport system permease protein